MYKVYTLNNIHPKQLQQTFNKNVVQYFETLIKIKTI